MKRILLAFAVILLFCNSGSAQLAKKYVLIEQFTQASCGPCAAENPAFKSDILNPNVGKVHHIAYHTSWPGTDPMYNHNTSQSADRVSYYGVSGVPTFETLGENLGSTTQSRINEASAEGSPIKVEVTQTVNGTNLDVKVKVTTIGTAPAGSFVVRAAIVEQDVNYVTAPGSNGEKYFPNVFRRMLPSSAGDTYTPASQWDSVVYNYSYPISTVWKIAEIYTIAFVQNVSTKEILNSGSSLDLPSSITYAQLDVATNAFQLGAPSATTTYNATLSNKGSVSDDYKVKLVSNDAADWASSFTINGTTYTDSASITIAGGSSVTATIDVIPGATPSIGSYTFTIKSISDPTTLLLIKYQNIISGVTDLVVSNSNARGDANPANASSWQGKYTGGLAYAGNTAYTTTDEKVFAGLNSANALINVNNVYLNIGWTFPSLTDELVLQLTTFMNAGGNLLIAGQDIGWETMDAASTYFTPNTQAFYTNYLKAKYIGDGASNTSLKPITYDNVFGAVGNSNILDYYGGGNRFPDQISPLGNAEPIFYYNTSASLVGGVKSFNPVTGSKVVYLGVGLEMLSDVNVSNKIMKQAHDWFYGVGCFSVNVDFIKTNIKCKGDSTGNIDIDVYGGGPYSYVWSNSSSADSIYALAAATYTVTVTDSASMCVVQKQYTLTQPAAVLNTTFTTVNSTGTNGTAQANPSGGTAPYTYLWSNTKTTKKITGLAPGTYTVTITDANGCTKTGTATVGLITGIKEQSDLISNISIAPNPIVNSTIIFFELNKSEAVEISAYNVLGTLVSTIKEEKLQQGENKIMFDAAHLAQGIYYLNIKVGNETITRKVSVIK